MSAERQANKAADKGRGRGERSEGNADLGEVTQHAGELAQEAWQNSNELLHQAGRLVHTLQRGHGELGRQLTDVGVSRPYVALGAAAGVGFVLGGGLTLGLTRRLLGLGGRLAVSFAMRRVMQAASNLA